MLPNVSVNIVISLFYFLGTCTVLFSNTKRAGKMFYMLQKPLQFVPNMDVTDVFVL